MCGGGVDAWIAEVIDTDSRTLGYHQTVWTASLRVRYLRDHHELEVSRKAVSRAIARLNIRRKRPRHQLARRPDTWRQSKGG
jgi:transposase